VSLPKPLGIAFEEVVAGQGVVVDYLVEDSNAEKCGQIQPGDILIAVTAFKVSPMLNYCLSVHPPMHPSMHPPMHPPIHCDQPSIYPPSRRHPR